MKKFWKGLLVGVLIVVALVVMALAFFGGALIKTSVNTFGPALLGVPVSLQDARFSPWSGHVKLSGLHVGNPKGFKTESLFEAGVIDVSVDVASLFSDTVVIRRVLVHEPRITFERGLLTSNMSALQDQLGGGKEPAAPPAKDAKSGKKVVIDELTITDGKVKLSVTAAMGLSAPIALATVHMKNIGREHGTEGLGPADVVRIIIGTVLKSVVEAIGGVGGLAVDGLKAVGGGAVKIGEGAMDGMKHMGTGKAAEGAEDMGKGASQVGGAAVEGVKQLGKALGDLMTKSPETNAPASR